MKLLLKRIHFGETYTVGQLYEVTDFGQSPLCYVLEDKVREVDGQDVKVWKEQNTTAIPKGVYDVRITFSNRFQSKLPLLDNVPGFTGVRIHSGNSSKDTEGCLLVGMTWDGQSDWVGSSKTAMSLLMPLIERAEGCTIEIV
jgi:heme-degrading monooxygenase HmoA